MGQCAQSPTLPRQEAIQWTAPDGQTLAGLVTYPLIVQSHGGPRSADQFGIFAYGLAVPPFVKPGSCAGRLMLWNHNGCFAEVMAALEQGREDWGAFSNSPALFVRPLLPCGEASPPCNIIANG